ncbi:MAG: hypothetical protein EOP87_11555 [Verrucomicrobiaceae bacterium]|nr:MAG: hypothetical protein EOP87_11555 [Verrucomicrobiaceae bacterium]
MKNTLLILPLLVLAAVIVYQATRPGPPAEEAPPSAATEAKWKSLTTELEVDHLGGRVDESSAYGRYLNSLEAMDGPQLIAAWDELNSAQLPERVRERLEPSVLGALIRKETELALTRFATHVGDAPGGIGSQLFGGFRDLAERLPYKASQWMDQNIAAGTFGSGAQPKLAGGTPLRVTYERELIRSLLTNSPDQAAARLEALPESWRSTALQGADSPQGQVTYARMVRKFMTPDEQMQEFKRMAASAAYHGGRNGIGQLLDRISASKEERETITRHTPVPP